MSGSLTGICTSRVVKAYGAFAPDPVVAGAGRAGGGRARHEAGQDEEQGGQGAAGHGEVFAVTPRRPCVTRPQARARCW